MGNRSFHAILLNPPYLTVTLGCGLRGRDEKRFLVEAFQALVMGGLMIYIVPYYRMTEDVCQIFTDNFRIYLFIAFWTANLENSNKSPSLGPESRGKAMKLPAPASTRPRCILNRCGHWISFRKGAISFQMRHWT